jgi:phosphatidylethanolamine-binding protein (PEBP) family uncharacterized protein
MSNQKKNYIHENETCLAPLNKRKFPNILIPEIYKNYKYIALVVLDTSLKNPYYHALFYNIPANTNSINLNKINNYIPSDRNEKYTVMCPPRGTGEHEYVFTFYYLNDIIDPIEFNNNKNLLINYLQNNSIEIITIKKYFECPKNKNCRF